MAGEAKPAKEKGAGSEAGRVQEKAPEKAPEKAAEKAGEKAPEKPKKKLTREEKQALHTDRLKKTAIACLAGILAGVLSFFVDTASPTGTALGLLFCLAAIVFQKYAFFALKMDYLGLTAKDWFFQGFMTVALWFITWTILLSSA